MAGKRKRYSAEFKAKVALEAIRGEATIAELVSKHGVHQTVSSWKRQAIDGLAGCFRTGRRPQRQDRESEFAIFTPRSAS